MRLVWLADVLRAAGLEVVEVPGWKRRGSDEFDPVGVTWHATAGSRHGTAQGEVNVILNGSTSAPPPIAQLMIWRDGTIYVCAAGRCNHNKIGWAGPNEGLGNRRLLGIEMANDNRGEPWPAAQLDAARRATAVIMPRLGADPMRRLAGHYEHQPAAGRPAGETSIKTDPAGVDMAAERARVATLMEEDGVSADEVRKVVREELRAWAQLDPIASIFARTGWMANVALPRLAGQLADAGADVDEAELAARLAALIPDGIAGKVVDELRARLAE